MKTYFGHKLINRFRSKTPKGFYDKVRGHTGIDIDAPIGTEVSLPAQFTVLGHAMQEEMGLTLYLKDTKENVLVFSHLSQVLVEDGATVKPNTVFALTGNTGGKSTGAHLHIEVIAPSPALNLGFMTRTLLYASGWNINPEAYLDAMLDVEIEPTARDWCITHIPEANWAEFTDNQCVAFRSLAKRLVDWNTRD